MNTVFFSFDDEFEFSAKMPEELFVKAMKSTRPIFLTDDFMGRVAQKKPDQMIRDMVRDLHRDTNPDETDEILRWYYLFMDFEKDFPRMLLMQGNIDQSN